MAGAVAGGMIKRVVGEANGRHGALGAPQKDRAVGRHL